tara:strand:+ start:524 stop:850 length:327 start_codon:yes stop_codon:yes gene_type:complete
MKKQNEDILYMIGDKVSVLMRGSKVDGHQDAIITSIDTEDEVLRKSTKRTTLLTVYSEDEDIQDEVSTYDIGFYGACKPTNLPINTREQELKYFMRNDPYINEFEENN